MKFIEAFETAPIETLGGMVGDWLEMACNVVEVDGGIDVYFCDEVDDFVLASEPTIRFFGPQARKNLLKHLVFIEMACALSFLGEDYMGILYPKWRALHTGLSLVFCEAHVEEILGVKYSESGAAEPRGDLPKGKWKFVPECPADTCWVGVGIHRSLSGVSAFKGKDRAMVWLEAQRRAAIDLGCTPSAISEYDDGSFGFHDGKASWTIQEVNIQ